MLLRLPAMRALVSTTSRATCESCGAVHEASTPTPGFRCELCISAEVDAIAATRRRRAAGLFGIGALLLLVTVLAWSSGRDYDLDDGTPLLIYVGAAAVGCFGMGAALLRYRPKLKI